MALFEELLFTNGCFKGVYETKCYLNDSYKEAGQAKYTEIV